MMKSNGIAAQLRQFRVALSALEFVKELEDNIEEGLTWFFFPKEYRKIRTTNGLERVAREIKRNASS